MAHYLLDTGIVIRHLRGEGRVVALLRELGKRERLAISSITRLEIRAGMHPDEAYVTQKLLNRFLTIDLDRTIADRAGDFIQKYRLQNRSISVPDAIIAATAITRQLTLVTLNEKDFPMSGLSIFPIPTDKK